jgi:hypothetical protein
MTSLPDTQPLEPKDLQADGWGVLTEFRQSFGATGAVLGDAWAWKDRLKAEHNGHQLLLGVLGPADLMALQIARTAQILDAVPYSTFATGRAYAGFAWFNAPRIKRLLGFKKTPTWLHSAESFIKKATARPSENQKGTGGVFAVLHARLSPEVVLSFPDTHSRRERVLEALRTLCGRDSPIANYLEPKTTTRICPVLGLDNVDALLLISADSLETLGALAGHARFCTWSTSIQGLPSEAGALSALGATDSLGHVVDVPLFASTLMRLGLPIHLDAVANPAGHKTLRAKLEGPADDATVAKAGSIGTELTFPATDEASVKRLFPEARAVRPFGPRQLLVRRWGRRIDLDGHATGDAPLTGKRLAQLVKEGLHLEDVVHERSWTGIRATTTVALASNAGPPASLAQVPGVLARLARTRRFHAEAPNGLVGRWIQATTAAEVPASTEERGVQLLLAVLRRLLGDPELYAVTIPLAVDLVGLAEALAEERVVKDGPPRRTRRARALARRIDTALHALEEFADSHPVDVGESTVLQGRRAVRAGRAADFLVVDAIGGAIRGVWDLLSPTTPAILVTHHDGSTLKARLVGESTLLVSLPDGPMRLSVPLWDILGVCVNAALSAITYAGRHKAGPRVPLQGAAARESWDRLAARMETLPGQQDTIADLVDALDRWLPGHSVGLWSAIGEHAVSRHMVVMRSALALLSKHGDDIRPWGVLGPNMARFVHQQVSREPDRRQAVAAMIVLVIFSSTASGRTEVTSEAIERDVETVLSDLRRNPAWLEPVNANRALDKDTAHWQVHERIRCLTEDCGLLPDEVRDAVQGLIDDLPNAKADGGAFAAYAELTVLAEAICAQRAPTTEGPAHAARSALWQLLREVQPTPGAGTRVTTPEEDATWPPFMDDAETDCLQRSTPATDAPTDPLEDTEPTLTADDVPLRLLARGLRTDGTLAWFRRRGGGHFGSAIAGTDSEGSPPDSLSQALDKLAAIGMKSAGPSLIRLLILEAQGRGLE